MTLPARYQQVSAPMCGGYGAAFQCLDLVLNRHVLIKEIHDPAHINRIIDEIAALHAAKSKHVVEVFDVLVTSGGKNLAIVEEFLPGDDLSTFKFDPKTPLIFLKCAYQIARGLADIHAKNIVHRDIKPNNMKLDVNGYVKIFDFGLAKGPTLPGSTTSLTGTPGYMPPELFSAPPIIDKPVDVYAFGVMMHVFVNGVLPPCAQPWPKPPVALAPGQTIDSAAFPYKRLVGLLDDCLQLNPLNRPTMDAMVNALSKELLFGRHRATLTTATNTLVLSKVGDIAKAMQGSNLIEVAYDGYDFEITNISGSVFINNRLAKIGEVLDGAHVLTLGASGNRLFVTFDVSHPEVRV